MRIESGKINLIVGMLNEKQKSFSPGNGEEEMINQAIVTQKAQLGRY